MKFFKGVDEPENTADKGAIDTVIGPDVAFEGTLEAARGVCVEGTFKGRLKSKGIVLVNQGGTLRADVTAAFVVVHGELTGNVLAGQQLDIGPTGRIVGDVEAAAVTIAKGGMLVGHCKMRSEQILLEEIDEPSILQGIDKMASEPAAQAPATKTSARGGKKSPAIQVEDRDVDDIIVPLEGDDTGDDQDDETEITLVRE